MLPDSRLTRARLLTESRRSKAARRWPTAMDTDFLFAALMHWQAVRLCPVWVDFTHGKCHAGEGKENLSRKSAREPLPGHDRTSPITDPTAFAALTKLQQFFGL